MRNFHQPNLRVLCLTPTLAPGGAEQMMSTLIRHACRVKYVGCVCCGGDSERLAHQLALPIFPVEVPEGESAETLVNNRVGELVKNGLQFDLIFYWGFGSMDFKWAGTPTVCVSHGSGLKHEIFDEGTRLWLEQRSNSFADFNVAVSESGKYLYSEEVRSRKEIFVIHNGSDVERTRPCFGGEWQREAWGVDPKQKVVLFLGRLFLGKGPDVAIKALEFLSEDYVVVIHGWGNQRAKLDDLASRFPGRVIFPEPRTHQLGDIYDAADVCVIPSKSEAFPLVMVEAWQAAVPLVCSEFNTLGEIERKYADGKELAIHVPLAPEPEDVAKAILKPVDWEMVQRARSLALDKFSATAMVGRWESFFLQCVMNWYQRGWMGITERS